MSSSLLSLILIMKVFSGHSLTCQRVEYKIRGECCPMCPAGSRVKTDCTELRSTSCLPCIEGTYTNEPNGLKNCFPCTNCDAGSGLKIKTSCKSTSNTVCEPLDGFYCTDVREDDCVKAERHTSCQPGQYIRQKGTALTDTECTDCSGGTFSDGTFTSCQPHTQCESLKLIKPGTASADAECGETRLDVTTIVICTIIVPFLLICIPLLVCFIKKKLGKKRNADVSRQENTVGEQMSGMLNGD